MEQDATYRRLIRVTLAEIDELIKRENFNGLPPIFGWGGQSFETGNYYNRELQYHHWRLNVLEKHGWTFDEYMVEKEKNAIMQIVDEFNQHMTPPQEMIDRVKVFFPNAKFTPAKLEFE